MHILLAVVAAGGCGGDDDSKATLAAAQLMETRGAELAAARGYSSLGRSDANTLSGHLAWASFLMSVGRHQTARGPAGVATRLDPYGAAPYAALGLSSLRAGQGDQGRTMLDKALEMSSRDPRALLAVEWALRAGGETALADAVLGRALALAGSDTEVLFRAAARAAETGRDEQARQHSDALRRTPGGVVGEALAAEAWLAAGRPLAAVAPLQAAIRALGANALLYRALGRALLGSGAPPIRAAAAFRAAMAADPDDLDAAVGLGLALVAAPNEAGAADLALTTLDAVLHREPAHAGALLAKASLHRARGDIAAAETVLHKIRVGHPGRNEADVTMALCRLDREDPYAAIDLLEKLLVARPDLRHARINLALAYLRAGRSGEAQAAVGEAIRGLPESHPLVALAREMLTASGGAR